MKNKPLSRAHRTVRRWEPYIGLLIATGIFSWLGKKLTVFGELGWPEAIFLGVGTGAVLVLALAAGLAGWRYFRPFSAAGDDDVELFTGASLPYDDAQLRAELSKLHESFKALGDLVSKHETDLEFAKDGEDSLRASIQAFMKAPMALTTDLTQALDKRLSERLDGVAGDIQDIRRGCAKLEGTIEKNEKHVSQSLYAIQAKEQLHQLASEIERDADDLYLRLKGGENYTKQDWDQWVNVEHHWERTVKRWVDDARWYAKDVKKLVLTVDDKEYDDGEWSVLDSQFPNADAVRRFKRHRIIHSHWIMARDTVEAGLEKVAFQAETEEAQHGGKYHQ